MPAGPGRELTPAMMEVRQRRLLFDRQEDTMTRQVQGAPTRFDRILTEMEAGLDKAFRRLEQAKDGALANAQTVHGIADVVEKSNERMADKLNQMTNGGPPLDDTSDASPPSSSDAAPSS